VQGENLRLIQKHHLQLCTVSPSSKSIAFKVSVTYSSRVLNIPPITGPTAHPTAQTIDVIAIYNPRSLKEKESQMMTLTVVPIPEDPRSWTARPAIRVFVLGANAQSRLPPRKVVIAMSTMGLRPQMSATVPHTGVMAVLARMKAVPIQTYPSAAWNEPTIDGITGVKMVRSRDDSRTDKLRGAMMKAAAAFVSSESVAGDCAAAMLLLWSFPAVPTG
jgi:hypothetical protein